MLCKVCKKREVVFAGRCVECDGVYADMRYGRVRKSIEEGQVMVDSNGWRKV